VTARRPSLQAINKVLSLRGVPYLVGIDPAQGWAVYDREARALVAVDTVNFWEIIQRMDHIAGQGVAVTHGFYIETPQYNRPIWLRKKRKVQESDVRKVLKIAQDVGRNKGKAEALLEYGRMRGLVTVPIVPTPGTGSKLDAVTFNNLTGWEGSSSQHGRDAAMLVWRK